MENALLLHFPLTGEDGTEEEHGGFERLGVRVEEAIAAAGAGEFDGHEWGSGRYIMFLYGPDADALFKAVRPVLAAAAASQGGFGIKRYGEPDDPDAREERVGW